MDQNDFEVGVRVKWVNDDGDPPYVKGTVIGNSLSDSSLVAVEFDDGDLEKVPMDELEVIDAVLEQDFAKIAEKFEQAMNLFSEANQLAKNINTTLRDLYDNDELGDVSLMQELRNGGWSTSSMTC